MNKILILIILIGTWGVAWAHPMGNFSVSHYIRLQTTMRGVDVEYALDLAEIPTFELLREWKLGTRCTARNSREASEQTSSRVASAFDVCRERQTNDRPI